MSAVIIKEGDSEIDLERYTAWTYYLGKQIRLLSAAEVDTSSFGFVKDLIGTAKAVAVYDSRNGETADVAVEFGDDIPGGHDCSGTCALHRGLWFGVNHIEIT